MLLYITWYTRTWNPHHSGNESGVLFTAHYGHATIGFMNKSKPVGGEVEAMGKLEGALECLGPDERGRVLRWAFERFGATPHQKLEDGRSLAIAKAGVPNGDDAHEDLDELYSRATPNTEPERALVAAYWVQEVRGDGAFDAQTVNAKLKDLGHGVSNITRALDELKKRKPQLVIQIQKTGKSKRARKRYKVTSAGKGEVQRMLASSAEQ